MIKEKVSITVKCVHKSFNDPFTQTSRSYFRFSFLVTNMAQVFPRMHYEVPQK